jgi:hypothetical protein
MLYLLSFCETRHERGSSICLEALHDDAIMTLHSLIIGRLDSCYVVVLRSFRPTRSLLR